ncbi:UNVERIFIED_CONTAM: hypothetical protein Sradi_4477000 [Sesamum radiatum]|uniref:Uncharacterized protein n=1 Tax=Sesamum radiatum TaxID=300843 RepID=A0AAW2N6P4_SESRA
MGGHQSKNPSPPLPHARRNVLQEVFHTPLASLPIPRRRLARTQRNTRWMLWIPHQDLDISQQSITSWIFLAHHETRCTRAGEQMHEMPKACLPHTPTCQTPQYHVITVSSLPIGDGHSRTVPTYDWAKKIPPSCHRLLHEMVEAEPLARITEGEVMKFIWKNIICRFKLPREIIFDNSKDEGYKTGV